MKVVTRWRTRSNEPVLAACWESRKPRNLERMHRVVGAVFSYEPVFDADRNVDWDGQSVMILRRDGVERRVKDGEWVVRVGDDLCVVDSDAFEVLFQPATVRERRP